MRSGMSKACQKARESFGWARGHKLRVLVMLVVFALLAPRPARSQFLDPCCAILAAGLGTIANTLSSVVGGGLNGILSVEQNIRNFEQGVVWPKNLIAEAQALVGRLQGIFNQIQGVTEIPVNSATLPATEQLEGNLLSRNPNDIAQTSAEYTAVYEPVPNASAASPEVRNEIDMTDATAEAAMKRSIEIDALADLELKAANQINESIQTAAPGSAPIIEAQADAWLVRANAYTQAATADLMRVRAIALADSGESVKSGAANSAEVQQQIYNLLKRQ